jgi:guanine deaminase
VNKFILLDSLVKDAILNVKNGGGPFSAAITKNGKVIVKACNSVTLSNDPTAHAEVNVIRDACKKLKTFDLSGCEIYSSCQPCPMCLSACYWARVQKIYYAADALDAQAGGFSDQFIYDQLAVDIGERSIPEEQIFAKNRDIPFDEWRKKKNKIKY